MVILRDPAARDLLDGGPRRWPVVAAAALTILLALGAVAVIGAVVGLVTQTQGPRSPAAVPAPVPDPVPAPRDSLERPEEDVLTLPQPTAYLGAVPTGYPQTWPGAIAAAYGYSRVSTGLDVEPVLRAVRTMAARGVGWFAAHRELLADGLVAQRQGLGLPPVGPTGSASITVTPASYQVRASAGAASVTVLTLNVVSAVAADGTRTSGTVVLRWALDWDGSRWLAAELYSSAADDVLAVTPLTSQARTLGWKVAEGG